MSMHPGGLLLVAEGPWFLLNDTQLKYIHSFLCNIKDTNALIRVSKRFRKLFIADDVWQHIPLQYCKWIGRGVSGTDECIWRQIQDDAGLALIHGHRMRWMSHNTSRLKLYYGGLELSVLERWFGRTHPARTVLVLGAAQTHGGSLTQHFLAKMHYLVPESATAFHLARPSAKPLLAQGLLVDIEPSPRDSRSRNHALDPGTLVEASTTDPTFVYRRVGDTRLTFIGVDLPTRSLRRDLDYSSYYELTSQVAHLTLFID